MRSRSFFLFACVSVGAAACGGATSESSEPSPATRTPSPSDSSGSSEKPATGPGNSSAPTAPSLLAIDDSVTTVRLGLAWLGAVPGCNPKYRSVDYVRATRTMKWAGCAMADFDRKPSATEYPAVERVLDAAEADRVEAALRAITYTNNPPCGGYDGREYFMRTQNAAGASVDYSASNINCYGYRLAPDIAYAYSLFVALRGG